MCGITGTFSARGNVDPNVIHAMTAAIHHRGPDATGTWVSPNRVASVGSTRLAVIDLVLGSQPMQLGEGRYVLVMNGEIYNYRILRAELAKLGHRFRTQSDTEVVGNGFAEWGTAVFAKLNGMFAIAVYDQRERSMVIARDRMGIKPLYYYHDRPGGLRFASEIKALMRDPGVPRILNEAAVRDYLVLGYPVVPATFFADVHELEPGTWMRVTGDQTTVRRFWEWRSTPIRQSLPDAQREAKDAMLKSLDEHLVADVPIGAFLSGGIDSSLIVALLAKELGRSVKTYTVAFADAEYDESPYARAVAGTLGSDHHEIVLEPPRGDLSELRQIVSFFDQPFADSSAIPTYHVSRAIRQHVKVALGGDGGDEMFGGYRRFWYADVSSRVGVLPRVAVRAGSRAIQAVATARINRVARRLERAIIGPGRERFLALSCYVYSDELPQVLAPDLFARLGPYHPHWITEDPAMDGMEFRDTTIRYVLPGDYLRKVDMMSSAHGLEVRVPFLGNQVLDLAATLTPCLLYGTTTSKIILRRLAEEYLPPFVTAKPKAGFGIPLDRWLGSAGICEVAGEIASESARIRDLVSERYCRSVAAAFSGRLNRRRVWSRFMLYQRAYQLWSLELWMQKWKPSLP